MSLSERMSRFRFWLDVCRSILDCQTSIPARTEDLFWRLGCWEGSCSASSSSYFSSSSCTSSISGSSAPYLFLKSSPCTRSLSTGHTDCVTEFSSRSRASFSPSTSYTLASYFDQLRVGCGRIRGQKLLFILINFVYR